MLDAMPLVDTSRDEIAIFSPLLRHLVGEGRPLGGTRVHFRPNRRDAHRISTIIGLAPHLGDDGALAYARRTGRPLFYVDWGPFASVWRGSGFRPLSIIVQREDELATVSKHSPLVRALEDAERITEKALLERARALRELTVSRRVTRFGDTLAPLEWPEAQHGPKPVVVVVEFPEPSTRAGTSCVETMLACAAAEHPQAPIWLLPESPTGRPVPPQAIPRHVAGTQVRWLPSDIDRGLLLEQLGHVYTVGSTFGFEALLREVPVTVFGHPDYAGWGLTRDVEPVSRSRRASLDELVAATLLEIPRYFDWVLERETTAEAVVSHLSLQRERFLENQGRFIGVGFSLWKRLIVSRYLTAPRNNEVVFVRNASALGRLSPDSNSKVIVWASQDHADVERQAQAMSLPLWRLEDGFMRSVGLGSDWAAPGSLVFDPLGIYYDPRQPSKLEELLSLARLSDRELEEAEQLRQLILDLRISKYNAQRDCSYRPNSAPGQPVVFVPGQVADDASVRFGGKGVGSVEALLRAVRELEPGAHIVYKPHPDVLSGNRRGHVDSGLGVWFDELVLDVPIARCLERVNAVHTISSLVGFEALLRKIPVTCHGQPFYSGWGLTRDLDPLSRRTRRLSLSELVAVTLMRYPRYYHFRSGSFCTAAQMVSYLALTQADQTSNPRNAGLLRKFDSLLKLAKDLVHVG